MDNIFRHEREMPQKASLEDVVRLSYGHHVLIPYIAYYFEAIDMSNRESSHDRTTIPSLDTFCGSCMIVLVVLYKKKLLQSLFFERIHVCHINKINNSYVWRFFCINFRTFPVIDRNIVEVHTIGPRQQAYYNTRAHLVDCNIIYDSYYKRFYPYQYITFTYI